MAIPRFMEVTSLALECFQLVVHDQSIGARPFLHIDVTIAYLIKRLNMSTFNISLTFEDLNPCLVRLV